MLWGESASLTEGSGVKFLEHWRLDVVVDGLGGLNGLVFGGVVQEIGCPVGVSGWDTACEERQVLGGGPFREDKWCRMWSTNAVVDLAGNGGGFSRSYLADFAGYMAIGLCPCWCFGFWLDRLAKSVGMCPSRQGRFGDSAGFGDLGLWLGYRVLEDILLYRSDVLSGPVIPLALGIYVVTAWGGCSVDDGSGDVCIFCWGQE